MKAEYKDHPHFSDPGDDHPKMNSKRRYVCNLQCTMYYMTHTASIAVAKQFLPQIVKLLLDANNGPKLPTFSIHLAVFGTGLAMEAFFVAQSLETIYTCIEFTDTVSIYVRAHHNT